VYVHVYVLATFTCKVERMALVASSCVRGPVDLWVWLVLKTNGITCTINHLLKPLKYLPGTGGKVNRHVITR
jgi:hypothetical protein